MPGCMKLPPKGMSNDIETGCPLLPPETVAGLGFVEEPMVEVDEVEVEVEEVLDDVEVEVDEDVDVALAPSGAPDICPT